MWYLCACGGRGGGGSSNICVCVCVSVCGGRGPSISVCGRGIYLCVWEGHLCVCVGGASICVRGRGIYLINIIYLCVAQFSELPRVGLSAVVQLQDEECDGALRALAGSLSDQHRRGRTIHTADNTLYSCWMTLSLSTWENCSAEQCSGWMSLFTQAIKS